MIREGLLCCLPAVRASTVAPEPEFIQLRYSVFFAFDLGRFFLILLYALAVVQLGVKDLVGFFEVGCVTWQAAAWAFCLTACALPT